MDNSVQAIPEVLIYELQNGVPIYYQDYRSYLSGDKQLDEIRGSSVLQALILSRLMRFLQSNLTGSYEVLSNEIGIQFGKNSWRAADMALVTLEQLEEAGIHNKYLSFPPKLVIEVDTKAALTEISNPLGYYHEKTEELLQFGVPKLIWIFTDPKKVMVAQQEKGWITVGWNDTFEIIEGLSVSINQLLQ
jgi:Uma2 family endonuclease